MICTCERCLYTFESAAHPEQCPDCGKYAIRTASAREIAEYRHYRQEQAGQPLIPWYRVETPRLAVGS